MALGTAAARTSLPIERFNRIGVFIETEEQLNFRCGLAKQHIVLPTTVEGGEEEVPGPGEVKVEGTSKTITLPQRAPADRRRRARRRDVGGVAAARAEAGRQSAPTCPGESSCQEEARHQGRRRLPPVGQADRG